MSDYYGRPGPDAETLETIRKATEHSNNIALFQAIWALYLILQVLALMITPAICARIIACARGHNATVWFWVVLAFPPAILILLALGDNKKINSSSGRRLEKTVETTLRASPRGAVPARNPL